MATLKMMSGGMKSTNDPLSMSKSFKEYFLCCFKPEAKVKPEVKFDKLKEERQGPDGKSEESKLRDSGEDRADGSGSSRPASKVPMEQQANEMKQALSSALTQAKEETSSRPRSVMSVRTVAIESDTDGRHSRNTPLDTKLKEDRESISSRLSRFLTQTPKPREEEIAMGNESAGQSDSIVPIAEEEKVALGDTKSENVLSETVVDVKTENSSDPPPLSSTPAPLIDQKLLDAENEKQLFDVSDLQRDDIVVSGYSCGTVSISMKHEPRACRVLMTLHEARDIPSKERGGHSNSQVHVVLLPGKKIRHKTKVLSGENPAFNETFDFKVREEQMVESSVRIRLYGIERLKKNRLVGEVVVPFTPQYLNDTPFSMGLEPRSNLRHGESATSLNSANQSESEFSLAPGDSMELLLGLAYNSVTGRMAVEVVKGSNFKNLATNRPPDTYVKISLMAPNQQEISRSKTTVRRGQPNPLFKETFMFQVPQFQLADVSLLVSVFVVKSLKRKEMIGWFTMGQTSSSDEDLSHWTAVLESKGEQVSRWHNLLDP